MISQSEETGGSRVGSLILPLRSRLLSWQDEKRENQAEQHVVYGEIIDNAKEEIFN